MSLRHPVATTRRSTNALSCVYNVGNDSLNITIHPLVDRLISSSDGDLRLEEMPVHADPPSRQDTNASCIQPDTDIELNLLSDVGPRETQVWNHKLWGSHGETMKLLRL